MALTRCPDCGKDVSTFAKDCPACGRPISTFTSNRKIHNLDNKKSNSSSTTGEGMLSLIIAAVLTSCVYYFFPNLPWWVFVFLFFISFGSSYKGAIEMKANETIISKGEES